MSKYSQILWSDNDRVVYREQRQLGDVASVLLVRPVGERPLPASVERLQHEFELRGLLDPAWAVRPLELVREAGQTTLVLEDPGGGPLARLVAEPVSIEQSLRLAADIAAALSHFHQRGLVHKDLKPSHIFVNCTDGKARLSGFGLASRLPRERPSLDPPETIAGTLAYMAPEQTGRMNRSIDLRSDLYALGVTIYQIVAGTLPFTAADPMEWVHCHIARKPVPFDESGRAVPTMVADIIMKLLAKTPEERYQTAAGVEHDLRRCLADWALGGCVAAFPLGQRDRPDRLMIPERLHGRQRETRALIRASERIVHSGAPELLLVIGNSGMGKSSLVKELHKSLVPHRGIFASGKFDPSKRAVPYAALVQALTGLVRRLLSLHNSELAEWRADLLGALDVNARLLTDLIPELKLIIGDPPALDLDPQQARCRLMLAFRRFVGVFAQQQHPLALFVDDMQWLDPATLDVVEDLLAQDLKYLILVGAYREDEVDRSHPVTDKVTSIRDAGVTVNEIKLGPLGGAQVKQLIAESLRTRPERVESLSRLVRHKTGGNPFFVVQFLQTLGQRGLLSFDHAVNQWRWDLSQIRAERYTDNIADLMVARLTRLPPETLRAMQQLACLGDSAEIATLSTVLDVSEERLHAVLWDACVHDLVELRAGAYRFTHDRIQEAAYSLIAYSSRATEHLRIGRLMALTYRTERRDEAIFEIVGQLNRAAHLIEATGERAQIAEYNLLAGRRAIASTAYASALSYLNAGAELLDDSRWETHHDLAFALQLEHARCEFLTGQPHQADLRLAKLAHHTKSIEEKAAVACLHTDVCTTVDEGGRAVLVCLQYLRDVGIDWSAHPDDNAVRDEYHRIEMNITGRSVESLVELPLMEDPSSLATMEVLTKLFAPALQTSSNLVALVSCKAVNLSMNHGNCEASCFAYVTLSRVAGARFGDYQFGFRFGQLGCELVERRNFRRFEANTYLCFELFSLRWVKHVRVGRDLLHRAFEVANQKGDLVYAAYARRNLYSDMMFDGTQLSTVQAEAETGVAFAERMQFGHVVDTIAPQLALIRMLRGLTPKFGSLDNERFDEAHIECHLSSNPSLANPACYYWIRKLQARYIAGNFAAAVRAAEMARGISQTLSLFIEEAELHFYGALAECAYCDVAPPAQRSQRLEIICAHHRQLGVWSSNCPENFESCYALVSAEIARLENRWVDAARLYDKAILSAQQSGFIHNEALANEVASRFFSRLGLEKISRQYMRDARYNYLRWGADGKVRQLEATCGYLGDAKFQSDEITTTATPVGEVDLTTVIKVSQAVSGCIVLDTLVETIVRTAIEQAGAERGLLVLSRDGHQCIVAEAIVGVPAVQRETREVPVTSLMLPESILNHVVRTREDVILDDAIKESDFATDPYIQERAARSILCMPLLSQVRLTGVLYLENNLATRVFSPTRIGVLRLIASQAAIALENASLYHDLEDREARIRRLVDANIIGILIWDSRRVVLEANDAFLNLVGYSRGDMEAGKIGWKELTSPESRRDISRVLAKVGENDVQPFEQELRRKDGTGVPVILGFTTFEPSRGEGLAFVLDLTGRKKAEEEARQSERRYREMQASLEHANRIATMGHLSASIAHEVKQPITVISAYASAGLRWLATTPPNFDEVRRALEKIVEDSGRANSIIDRTRAFFRKDTPKKVDLDINATVLEVVQFMSSEAKKHNVTVVVEAVEDLPLVPGDRVQVQQVALNLIMNAIEAMSATYDNERTLMLRTGKTATEVHIAIEDTGPGLDANVSEAIFETFFTTKRDGLGMGLAICRSIIESHGGSLWMTPNPTQGVTFHFTLPTYLEGTPRPCS